MKPYKIIKSTLNEISEFENQVNEALEIGYEPAADLKVKSLPNGEIILLQPMFLEDALDFDSDE